MLRAIEPGRPSLAVPLPGHYASVLRVAPGLGIALATDSVGSKVIVAEQARRFNTIGIDCVAMNVNDLICVGAEPLAVLDYLAVESADPQLLREIALGLRVGAEAAGVEIPGARSASCPRSSAATHPPMASIWSARPLAPWRWTRSSTAAPAPPGTR